MKKIEFENAILCIINRFPDASLGDCYKIIEMFERDLNAEVLNKKSIDSDKAFHRYLETIKKNLSNKYIMEQKIEDDSIEEIISYMDNIDKNEIILAKIKRSYSIDKAEVYSWNLDYLFTVKQLFDNELITTRWNDDILSEEYLELALTTNGEVYLYKKEHGEELAEFSDLLENNNYNNGLLEDYLKSECSRFNPAVELNVEKFVFWANEHDRDYLTKKPKLKVLKTCDGEAS